MKKLIFTLIVIFLSTFSMNAQKENKKVSNSAKKTTKYIKGGQKETNTVIINGDTIPPSKDGSINVTRDGNTIYVSPRKGNYSSYISTNGSGNSISVIQGSKKSVSITSKGSGNSIMVIDSVETITIGN